MRALTLFCMVCSLLEIAFAQPDTLWTQTFGGSLDDCGRSVQQTTDGGYIIVGSTDSFGTGYNSDVYLIKTDGLGNERWSRTYGGDNSDYGYCVQQITDGGYIITGMTQIGGSYWGPDVYLVKTDVLGNELWYRTFGGTDADWGYSVQQTFDGGYIIVGHTESFGAGNEDIYLIKTNYLGAEDWSHTFGGSGYDRGFSVQQTADSGFVFTGEYYDYNFNRFYVRLIKVNRWGAEVWSRSFGGGFNQGGYCVQQTTDGGFIVAGYISPYSPGYQNIYLIKTDESGDDLWSQVIGESSCDEGYSVQQTSDGGYIIAGSTVSNNNNNVYLVKTDGSGNELWSQMFGGSDHERGYSVQQTEDGGYIVAGVTTSLGAGNEDVYLIRVDSEGTIVEEPDPGNRVPLSCSYLSIAPNPFNPTTAISYQLSAVSHVNLSVYDVSGRKVATLVAGWRDAGSHEVTFDGSDLASGIYFCLMEVGEFVQTRKMVLMK
ncbi:T9SS type A sorting domain-containing protein [bacterium]|nr:T9SS type A sorting domain-containing protein [bacterium]